MAELYSKDNYSFRNNPENVSRTENYSQVCVFEISDPVIKELDLDTEDHEDIKSILDVIVLEDLGTRYKYLEIFNDKPVWCKGNHRQPHNGSYILFAIHKDDMEKFAHGRFKYALSWLEDKTSKNNGYYDRNYYPERVLSYRTWCGDVSPEMIKQVKARYEK